MFSYRGQVATSRREAEEAIVRLEQKDREYVNLQRQTEEEIQQVRIHLSNIFAHTQC